MDFESKDQVELHHDPLEEPMDFEPEEKDPLMTTGNDVIQYGMELDVQTVLDQSNKCQQTVSMDTNLQPEKQEEAPREEKVEEEHQEAQEEKAPDKAVEDQTATNPDPVRKNKKKSDPEAKKKSRTNPKYCCHEACHQKIGSKWIVKGFMFSRRNGGHQARLWQQGIQRKNPDGSEWDPFKQSSPVLCAKHFASGERSWSVYDIDYIPTAFKSSIYSDMYRIVSVTKCPSKGWHYDQTPKTYQAVDPNDSLLSKFWDSPFKDVKIACRGNQEVKCHMVVLSFVSPLLKKMLTDMKDTSECCTIVTDYRVEIVSFVLRKLYCVSCDDEDSLLSDEDQEELASLVHTLKMNLSKPMIRKSKRKQMSLEEPEKVSETPMVKIIRHGPCEACISYENAMDDFPEIKVDIEMNVVKKEEHGEIIDCDQDDHLNAKPDDDGDEIVMFKCTTCDVDVETTTRKHNSLLTQLSSLQKPGKKQTAILYQCADCRKKKKKVSAKKNALPANSESWISSSILKKRNEEDAKRIQAELFKNESKLCPECGAVFSNAYTLQKHINAHSGIKTEKCPDCDESFVYKTELERHKKEKHPEKQLKIKCTDCVVKLRNMERDINQHMRQHHAENLPFNCSSCSYGSSKKEDLDRHERVYHSQRVLAKHQKIQCAQCPAMLMRKKLTRHVKSHHNPKLPHQCSFCAFRSISLNGIQVHEAHYHFERINNKSRIPCGNGCGTTFTQIPYMRYHMRRFCKMSLIKEELVQREKGLGNHHEKQAKNNARRRKYHNLLAIYENNDHDAEPS